MSIDARACRITKVTTYVVGMRWRNCVFARVESDEGISGIGEGSLEYQPKAVEAAIQQIAARYAVGRSAFATEKLLHDILRNEFMHSPIINSAAAALEMAMLDIVGKALGRPIYDLLGGKVHDVLPAYANAWYGVGKTPQEIGAAAAAAAARGYRGLKFDPFEDMGRDPDKASIRKAVEIVAAVEAKIETEIAPFGAAVDRLDEITGVGRAAAQVIIAEIGVDMGRFPTPAHLASWARFAPGVNQSAGKTKGKNATGHGNPYLARVLGEAAVSAGRTDSFLGERYRRIARRRGKKKAIVAVGRSILVIIWHLLADPDARFHDLGSGFYDTHVNADRAKRNHIRQLEALGYKVTLQPAA